MGGEHDGHTFMDYANRDEDTGQVKQGSKAWSIFEACLGRDFHKRPGVSLESLVGKQFVGQVTQTRTGSRNKVEHGTVGPVPAWRRSRRPQSRMTATMKTTRSRTCRFEGSWQRGGLRVLPAP